MLRSGFLTLGINRTFRDVVGANSCPLWGLPAADRPDDGLSCGFGFCPVGYNVASGERGGQASLRTSFKSNRRGVFADVTQSGLDQLY